MMSPKINRRGFTLLEILLVIGIIAILAGIVIIAINPSKQLAAVRDAERKTDLKTISNAMIQFYIDKGFYPGSGTLSTTSLKEICNTGSVSATTTAVNGNDCGSLTNLSELVPVYITAIPVDPSATSTVVIIPTAYAASVGTGYKVARSVATNQVSLQAPLAEITSVAVGKSPTKTISSFTVPSQVSSTIIESSHTISVVVPNGTNLTSLTPAINIFGDSVSPATGVAQNFTSPVIYTVTAADGTTQNYTVTVNAALNSTKAITSFVLAGVSGSINEGTHTITLTVPNGTNLTALVPTISITGASVSPASGVAHNFTATTTYTVTAENSDSQDYSVVVTVVIPTCTNATPFENGDGTAGSPYGICNWTQLNHIRDSVATLGSYYVLLNNLDSNSTGYSGIGDNWTPINYCTSWCWWDHADMHFSGNLNGNNYTISSLVINKPGVGNIGMFAYVDGGTISNLGLVGVNVTGNSSTGGLVGYQNSGTITNSYTTGTVTGADTTGGLVGNNRGTISYSHSGANVSGGNTVGGLAGNMSETYSVINNSYTTGSVTGSGNSVGGLVGSTGAGAIISKCYASGSVNGSGSVGGLLGHPYGLVVFDSYSTGNVTGGDKVGGFIGYTNNTTISNSYSKGIVSGSSNVGGFSGYNWFANISNSFWDKSDSGQLSGGGGTETTVSGMKTLSTFTGAGWDMVSGGTNLNNGYPYLGWQIGNESHTWFIP